MENRKSKAPGIPKFANEQDEAKWWASGAGRKFVKQRSAEPKDQAPKGSSLVKKLTRAASVQIALRLPAKDLARARDIAERKGIGYQTLLKMIVHEGLLVAERQNSAQ